MNRVFNYGIRVERVQGGEWAIVGSPESIIRVLEAMLRQMGKDLADANAEIVKLEGKAGATHE